VVLLRVSKKARQLANAFRTKIEIVFSGNDAGVGSSAKETSDVISVDRSEAVLDSCIQRGGDVSVIDPSVIRIVAEIEFFVTNGVASARWCRRLFENSCLQLRRKIVAGAN